MMVILVRKLNSLGEILKSTYKFLHVRKCDYMCVCCVCVCAHTGTLNEGAKQMISKAHFIFKMM